MSVVSSIHEHWRIQNLLLGCGWGHYTHSCYSVSLYNPTIFSYEKRGARSAYDYYQAEKFNIMGRIILHHFLYHMFSVCNEKLHKASFFEQADRYLPTIVFHQICIHLQKRFMFERRKSRSPDKCVWSTLHLKITQMFNNLYK